MPSPKGPPELKHLDHVLVSPLAIKRRIAQLGAELNKDYAKKDLMVVAIGTREGRTEWRCSKLVV